MVLAALVTVAPAGVGADFRGGGSNSGFGGDGIVASGGGSNAGITNESQTKRPNDGAIFQQGLTRGKRARREVVR